MTEFRGTYRVGDREVRPLVSLVMNFTKPTDTKLPAAHLRRGDHLPP